ncbi:uncharacterized protein N7511_009636 [Penicillium nucicola]|uniref:uncharacterized protein n=1 Tax=Penicillium nucicola TaxID=1850975 RepID=UPI00254525DD|nr:uncharacterized protein N7511_009636 [Penicillium nucicola]KAJ5747940.1 hypothetical protein N7511_009636 [Penicillium nucicola]
MPIESKDQVQSLINPDGSDMRRMSDNIDRDLITIPQHTSSDGNAPTPEIPRRSGRLKSKHVTTPNPRNYKPIKLKPSKPSSKKQKPAASPANDESVQPVILRLASIPEPSQLTDKLFDSSVEELWRVHGELCYERAILERRIWALGEDINKLAEVISHREKRAPTPVRGSKWGV